MVIPTLDAADDLPQALAPLAGSRLIREIIVSDGGSRDETIAIADAAGARVVAASRRSARPPLHRPAGTAAAAICADRCATCFAWRCTSPAYRRGRLPGCTADAPPPPLAPRRVRAGPGARHRQAPSRPRYR